MRIIRKVLERFTPVPAEDATLRSLLEEVGLEVKRMDLEGDTAFDLELLANRGDHYCYAGVARELHGRTGAGFQLPPTRSLHTGDAGLPVQVQTELCLRYTATVLEFETAATPLPADIAAPLLAAGLQSISPVVDVTNLVNLELGQPLHAFDADAIAGGIVVRVARKGETALPLFAESRVELPEGTLVIADEEKILAVAGVIGCEESKTTAGSRRLVLESATFDPISVRQASRALGLRTDSSVRFERGGDPAMALVGAERAVYLLTEICGARQVKQTGVFGGWVDPNRIIELDTDAAGAFLGIPIEPEHAAARLERYGFGVERSTPLAVRVPPGRLWDVEFAADLYEELAKSIGYNEIPSLLFPAALGAVPSPREAVKRLAEDVLVGDGFYEVFTDGFYAPSTAEALEVGADHPLAQHAQVLAAVDKGHSLLKNNALVQLLQGVGDNLRVSIDEIRMFEWAKTFHPNPQAGNGYCDEREVLAIVACGHARLPSWAEREPRPVDAWYLQGLLEELSNALHLPLRLAPEDRASPLATLLHPKRRATVVLEGRPVGILGEVHPSLCRRVGIKRDVRPCYLELDRAALEQPPQSHVFEEPPDQPPTTRNLAFTLPHGVSAGEVLTVMRAASPPWLDDLTVSDVYHHEQEGKPVRTLTFDLVFSNALHTRTTAELNEAAERLIGAMQRELGGKGVTLR